MEQILKDLKTLCMASGAAGQCEIVEACKNLLNGLVDSIEVDAMGNVLAVRHCGKADAPTILLEAHLDEIGFLVSYIDDNGFLHVEQAGGVDGRVLTAQPLIVHGYKTYCGVFGAIPPHLLDDQSAVPPLSKRTIDVGLSAEEAKKNIPLGSRVTFAPSFSMLNEHVVTAKALDDRAGIAAILHCLRKLDKNLSVNVAIAFCVQEELGCRGSIPAVNKLAPDEAIVVDVSFAATPDANPYECGKMGQGVMIGVSAVLNTGITARLQSLAKEREISQQAEVMGGVTGTDADRISTALLGVPTALLSIPLRYMHTPVETIDVMDVVAVGDLMAAYILDKGAKL
ncbi:MAG: M20/M25/M40 family metallo-hydrolase [Clostridia bacterium]|nr:M20/M25/M40 family metallo-hydrolase [Clostridia bacterium]